MSICLYIYICNVYVISIYLIFLPPPTAMRIKDTPKTFGTFWAPPAAVASLPATTEGNPKFEAARTEIGSGSPPHFLAESSPLWCDFMPFLRYPGESRSLHFNYPCRSFLGTLIYKNSCQGLKRYHVVLAFVKKTIKMGEPASHSAGPFWWSFLLRPFHLIGMWVKSGHPKCSLVPNADAVLTGTKSSAKISHY